MIAPQAQSKYYLPPNFKHVGSSWLTKENTLKETENVMRYFDAVFEAENLPKNKNLIVLGYSQGVSVALRYVAKRQINCSQLVIHSGGIPKELEAKDFEGTDIQFTADPEDLKNAPIEIVKVDKTEKSNSGTFNGEGKHKMYNQNKQISKDGFFKAYRLIDGLQYQYNRNGILTKVKRFKAGRYIGDAPLPKD